MNTMVWISIARRNGALYRCFDSKEQLIVECFTHIDKQAAMVFGHFEFNLPALSADPMGVLRSL